MKIILAPIDFSAGTPRILSEAAKLAGILGAHVIVVHVMSPEAVSAAARSGGPAEMTKGPREAAERKLLEARAELSQRGVMAHAFCLTGNPASHVVDQALKLDAECIVMGSRGDTAIAVARRAICPVMIVPVGKPRERRAPALPRRLGQALRP